MRGMSAAEGGELTGRRHLSQSVRDILATPIGTRVMRREYGSRCAELLDQPVGPGWAARARAAALDALARWEPRLLVTRVEVSTDADGRVEVAIDGVHRPDGAALRLTTELA